MNYKNSCMIRTWLFYKWYFYPVGNTWEALDPGCKSRRSESCRMCIFTQIDLERLAAMLGLYPQLINVNFPEAQTFAYSSMNLSIIRKMFIIDGYFTVAFTIRPRDTQIVTYFLQVYLPPYALICALNSLLVSSDIRIGCNALQKRLKP